LVTERYFYRSGGVHIIDLRSDTLTKPTLEMRSAMYEAEVGDDSRLNISGRGEDPTVQKLEDYAADITGNEAALFCNSGTMANYIAILTHCVKRGDIVLMDRASHIYRSEKALFMERLGGLTPLFYQINDPSIPNLQHITDYIKSQQVKLLCLENTHNDHGGTCLSPDQTEEICATSHQLGVPVHLDGARIANAAVYFNTNMEQLTAPADSVMFCLSKGLGAPIGSMLCGSHGFIGRARKMRKLLGGAMRQAGIVAAAGLISLKDGFKNINSDHENARFLAKRINHKNMKVDLNSVQTNIIKADVSASGHSAYKVEKDLEPLGVRLKATSETAVRMITYQGITKTNVSDAGDIINEYIRRSLSK